MIVCFSMFFPHLEWFWPPVLSHWVTTTELLLRHPTESCPWLPFNSARRSKPGTADVTCSSCPSLSPPHCTHHFANSFQLTNLEVSLATLVWGQTSAKWSSRTVRGHIQRNIRENEKNKSRTKYQINTCGTMIKKGWWTNCSWSFSQNHKHSEKKHYRGSRRGGRNYSKSHGVKWRSSKNPTQKSNYQMIYSFWEFQPLLAPPLVGMCIIQTGFINIH